MKTFKLFERLVKQFLSDSLDKDLDFAKLVEHLVKFGAKAISANLDSAVVKVASSVFSAFQRSGLTVAALLAANPGAGAILKYFPSTLIVECYLQCRPAYMVGLLRRSLGLFAKHQQVCKCVR